MEAVASHAEGSHSPCPSAAARDDQGAQAAGLRAGGAGKVGAQAKWGPRQHCILGAQATQGRGKENKGLTSRQDKGTQGRSNGTAIMLRRQLQGADWEGEGAAMDLMYCA